MLTRNGHHLLDKGDIMSKDKTSQFHFTNEDILDFQLRLDIVEQQAKVLTALIVICRLDPEFLNVMIRSMALTLDGWQFNITTSDPNQSLQAQKSFNELMATIHDYL